MTGKKKIILGADRLAVTLKDAIVEHLEKDLGYEVIDVGTKKDGEVIEFYDVACRVCGPIQQKMFDKGIVMCGSGAGVSMVSNKHKGIRCVLCQSPYEARNCRIINNANVLAMGGNLTTPLIGNMMVDEFLETDFMQDLSEPRREFMTGALGRVNAVEEKNFR